MLRIIYEKIKKKLNKAKEDNNGLTLVELLAAITILAICIVPIFQVFVISTRTNSNARVKLQSNITANSVLESAKAFSIKKYSVQCNKEYTTDSDKESFTLIAGDTHQTLMQMPGTSCCQLAVTITTDGTKKNYVLSEMAKGSSLGYSCTEEKWYVYAINGIKQSQNSYDAVVVFKELPYRNIDIAGKSYGESDFVGVYDKYNKAYNIEVYVYRHMSTPVYLGKNLGETNKNDSDKKNDLLANITGSKIDSVK